MSYFKVGGDGYTRWYNEDNAIHKEDGPAMISSDGREYWYIDGLLHREDGPAVTYPDGYQVWCVFGKDIK